MALASMMDRNWSVCIDARSLFDVASPIPRKADQELRRWGLCGQEHKEAEMK